MNTTQEKTTTEKILGELAQKHGGLTPEIVLQSAKSKASPLHALFEWDDAKAGDLYRLEQARGLIRRIKVIYAPVDHKEIMIRAYHCVQITPEAPRGVYVTAESALTDYREQLLEQCKRDMMAFKRKYAALEEVAAVIDAMDNFA